MQAFFILPGKKKHTKKTKPKNNLKQAAVEILNCFKVEVDG